MNLIGADYLSIFEENASIICVFSFVFGAVVAWLIDSFKFRFSREGFFLHSSGVGLAAVLLSALWVSPLLLISANVVGFVVALTVVGCIFLGAWLAVVGSARSRDAFHSKRWAFLAFLPLINFVLLFLPSRDRSDTDRRSQLSYQKIAIGVVLIFLTTWSSILLGNKIERNFRYIESSPEAGAEVIAWQIRRLGLPAAIEILADRHRSPRRIDEITELSTVESEGRYLIRNFSILREGVALPATFERTVRDAVCQSTQFQPIYAAGGIVRDQYRSSTGEMLSVIEMSAEECGE